MTGDINNLKKIANGIRTDVIKMLVEAGSGHPAGSLGMADIFAALYFAIARHDPANPKWEERDRIILSNGHICPVLYTTLAWAGYFPRQELMTLRKLNTRLQGHPHNMALPGVENSSGPLGQGVSIAAGIACALKHDRRDSHVFCLMGDGELQEGQVWEAMMFINKYKLDNFIGIVDRNFIQIDGFTEDVMPLEDLAAKFSAFGLNVLQMDGHDFDDILTKIEDAKKSARATVIIAKTVPGKGVSFMERRFEWHGKPPSPVEAEVALKELAQSAEI
ncbi:MAG: transketolase [Deltaproteobacteria bacterium]|nr:transketolase [Deltaproteobacteria bacterium]